MTKKKGRFAAGGTARTFVLIPGAGADPGDHADAVLAALADAASHDLVLVGRSLGAFAAGRGDDARPERRVRGSNWPPARSRSPAERLPAHPQN